MSDEVVTVSREALLRTLEALRPGLSTRGDLVEQATCFAFRRGRVYSYNGEILCKSKAPFGKELEGSVPAADLLAVLGFMPDDEIDVGWDSTKFTLHGRRKKINLRFESSIEMPIGEVPRATEYSTLPTDFQDAIACVKAAAGDAQEAPFHFKCLHMTPAYMEASNTFVMTRYRIALPLGKECLVLADKFKELGPLGMTEMAEADGWLHFRNPAGVSAAVRTHDADYPNCDFLVDFNGDRLSLPKGLIQSAKMGGAVLDSRKDDLLLQVEPGLLRITARGLRGESVEERKVKYAGRPVAWNIQPGILADVAGHSPECEVNDRFLKIDNGRYVFVASVALDVKVNGKGAVS